jgi:spermidine/putrescine transport system substrate-binding protein
MTSHPRSRRDFLATAARAALAASVAAPVLSACTGERRPPAPGLEPELNIYNWFDYIGPETIAGFEQEFGVRVTYDTYESNEEMLGKLMAGATGYDLVVPTGYQLPLLRERALVRRLDRSKLTNWGNLMPLFQSTPADPGGEYGVPWQWGITGIAYRADLLPSAPDSWAAFLDGSATGRATMLDDGREVLGAMLRYRGHSLNSTDPAELAGAREDAIAAKAHLLAFMTSAVKGQLVAGDVAMAQLWNGDTHQAQRENPNIAFVLPREGSLIFNDYMVLLRDAPHPNAAMAFLDYILRPDVGAAISEETGYGTPNRAAHERMRDPIPYPSPEELARLEYQLDLGSATALWDRTWTEVKASA